MVINTVLYVGVYLEVFHTYKDLDNGFTSMRMSHRNMLNSVDLELENEVSTFIADNNNSVESDIYLINTKANPQKYAQYAKLFKSNCNIIELGCVDVKALIADFTKDFEKYIQKLVSEGFSVAVKHGIVHTMF